MEPVTFSPTVPLERAGDETVPDHSVTTILADSTWSAPAPGIDPSKAMFHSLALPGWGQLDNNKRYKAALFIATELVCIGGYIYVNHRVRHDDLTEWGRDNLRTDRNTFVIYWMLSKLLGMVDAYVDAHLAHFDVSDITPKELESETEQQ